MSNYSRVSLLDTLIDENGDKYLSPFSGAYIRFLELLEYDKTYTVTEKESANLPLISYQQFNTIDLWWVIGVYNGIVNPFYEIIPGLTIKIPTINSINTYLDKVKSDVNNQQGKVITLS